MVRKRREKEKKKEEKRRKTKVGRVKKGTRRRREYGQDEKRGR